MQVWLSQSSSSGATECGATLLPGDIKDSSSSGAVALQDGSVTAKSWRLSRARQLLCICNFVGLDLVASACLRTDYHSMCTDFLHFIL